MKKKNKSGFTLVELLGVLAIFIVAISLFIGIIYCGSMLKSNGLKPIVEEIWNGSSNTNISKK